MDEFRSLRFSRPMINFRSTIDQVVSTTNPKLPFPVQPGRSQEYRYRLIWLREAAAQVGSEEWPVEVAVNDEIGNVYTHIISQETRDRDLYKLGVASTDLI